MSSSIAQLRAWLRFFFSQTDAAPRLAPLATDAWLSWLEFHQLTSLAWTRLQSTHQLQKMPSQAVSSLGRLVFSRTAISATRDSALQEVLGALQQQGIETVLLKGAAFNWSHIYATPAWREMNDFDLWVQAAQMLAAVSCLQQLGYHLRDKKHRPLALSMAEQQEIEMIVPHPPAQAVDLHYRPLQGKWLASVLPPGVEAGLWQRREPVSQHGIRSWRLGNEDNLLHLVAHLAVNHQMGRPGLRALWDVATSLRAWPVDWDVLLRRAGAWHLRMALYLVLSLAAEWVAAPVPDDILRALRPTPWRRACLHGLLPREAVLRGATLSASHRRYLYLLALLDEPQVGYLLARQAIFPRPQWLRLRYAQDGASSFTLRYHHLWRFLHSPRF